MKYFNFCILSYRERKPSEELIKETGWELSALVRLFVQAEGDLGTEKLG